MLGDSSENVYLCSAIINLKQKAYVDSLSMLWKATSPKLDLVRL